MNTTQPTRFILTGLIAASASFVLAASGSAQGTLSNPFSTILHTVDGQFTGGISGGAPVGEWSDTAPAAFHSTGVGTATSVPFGSPGQNSLLYATLAQRTPASDIALFLMYDFLPRTDTFVDGGEIFASVTFPVTLQNQQTGQHTTISVLFQGKFQTDGDGTTSGASGSFFDVFVDINLDGVGDGPASGLGIRGVAGFGPSPLSNTNHLLVELEVPLRIPDGFSAQSPGSPLPGNGINPATGLYDPAPAFWGGAGAGNGGAASDGIGGAGGLQSASAGLFTIQPSGSVNVTPVPEPSSAALLLAGLGAFAARRRKC